MSIFSKMTDEELALSYIDGSVEAFDLLLERNKAKLFSYILFVVRDREKANDIFQDTFVKVIIKMQEGKYSPTGKFSAWLIRIAHNVIMDLYRSQRNEHMVEANEDNDLSNIRGTELLDGNIENVHIREEVSGDVRRMMEMLPETQREVVFMRFYQELSFKEIAEITNVSINTSLGRMRYAILNLRKMAKTNHITLMSD
ncbi:RNA polymerase subunit sigma-24 [Prevotella sp. oral taxon 376]|uniref:sigma-70 family RNA polymerase sigma factor n=1 Tax=Prevotella sp. oral taxon 376 TaxID=712466 RepID=UPI000D1E5380|nr:sigma-70 family RNA polymerase sigma factor [Prevotella sp. oral taxon 376]PTL32847.1 RNA polymerase subunit sigma-24 [Prevotella sp. oral taxon 376]